MTVCIQPDAGSDAIAHAVSDAGSDAGSDAIAHTEVRRSIGCDASLALMAPVEMHLFVKWLCAVCIQPDAWFDLFSDGRCNAGSDSQSDATAVAVADQYAHHVDSHSLADRSTDHVDSHSLADRSTDHSDSYGLVDQYTEHSDSNGLGPVGCAEYHHSDQHAHLRPHSGAESPADRLPHADTIGLADACALRNAHCPANSEVLRTARRVGLAIATLCCMRSVQ